MEVIERISIDEFDEKKYLSKLVGPFDKAVLTHYLHNYGDNDVSKHYEKDAMKVLNNLW